MIRKLFCCVLALAIGAATVASAATPTPSTGPRAFKSNGYKVEARVPGTTAWHMMGTFSDKGQAEKLATSLYREGKEVRFTRFESVTILRPSTPSPSPSPSPTPSPSGPVVRVPGNVSVVSWGEAMSVFNRMKAQHDIAFRYPADGCYARAHLMCEMIQGMGLQPGKAWTFDDSKQNRLRVTTPNHPRGYVQWWYHVAPILKVRDNTGKVRTHVIDPSMFDRPATIFAWQKKMYNPQARFLGRLECTALHKAPTDGKGKSYPGTGYYPGADPNGGLTRHARTVMAMYKPHEGTAWTPPRPTTRSTTTRTVSAPATISAYNHLATQSR